MAPQTIPEPVLNSDWPTVLDTIETSLAQAQVEAVQREQAFQRSFPVADGQGAEATAIAPLDDCLAGFQARYEQAERQAAKVDALLQAGQDAMHQWLASAEALRQRLAQWEATSVR
jgi:hypothetical protein